jgi:hypothetical protein
MHQVIGINNYCGNSLIGPYLILFSSSCKNLRHRMTEEAPSSRGLPSLQEHQREEKLEVVVEDAVRRMPMSRGFLSLREEQREEKLEVVVEDAVRGMSMSTGFPSLREEQREEKLEVAVEDAVRGMPMSTGFPSLREEQREEKLEVAVEDAVRGMPLEKTVCGAAGVAARVVGYDSGSVKVGMSERSVNDCRAVDSGKIPPTYSGNMCIIHALCVIV